MFNVPLARKATSARAVPRTTSNVPMISLPSGDTAFIDFVLVRSHSLPSGRANSPRPRQHQTSPRGDTGKCSPFTIVSYCRTVKLEHDLWPYHPDKEAATRK